MIGAGIISAAFQSTSTGTGLLLQAAADDVPPEVFLELRHLLLLPLRTVMIMVVLILVIVLGDNRGIDRRRRRGRDQGQQRAGVSEVHYLASGRCR